MVTCSARIEPEKSLPGGATTGLTAAVSRCGAPRWEAIQLITALPQRTGDLGNSLLSTTLRAVFQLQSQTDKRRTPVHVSGLPTPTMNSITKLCFRLFMSLTSRPMKWGQCSGY